MPRTITTLLCSFLTLAAARTTARSHDIFPRTEPTYTITAPADPDPDKRILRLHTHLDKTPTPARFSLTVDGKPWTPAALNEHGIRFTSIHTAKKQRATILYARGTGPVECNLPPGAREAELIVTRGPEFLPFRRALDLARADKTYEITAELRRWSHLREDGWLSCDEHLHYERSDPAHDTDWFTMLRADGLDAGFFMILDGGNLPGPWAGQYAYGKTGRVSDNDTHLIPGEEFRCTAQGHNNLHGIAEVLHPLSVGRGKTPPESHHWPATHDVLEKIHATGGIGGPAHGGTFGRASTAIRDAVLGASAFFELANTHLYELDPWYRLLNCGFLLPPVAGTDLPNFPSRAPTDPFFGETRTYVRVDDPATATFEDWKSALRAGRSFITSGPLITLTIDGHEPGETIQLPAGGKEISLAATLASPRPLTSFEIIHNGAPLALDIEKTRGDDGIHRWTIAAEVEITQSSWFAARGSGTRKNLLWAETGILQRSIAHTAAIPVLLDDQPLFDEEAAAALMTELRAQRDFYATSKDRYPDAAARLHTLALFDRAIARLREPETP